MSMSDCPKCWETPCSCGHEYRRWSDKGILDQIAMLKGILVERNLLSDEPAEFSNVGNLREMLECLPDEREIHCQVAGSQGGAWNLHGTLHPGLGVGTKRANLVLSHPSLTCLPPIPNCKLGDELREKLRQESISALGDRLTSLAQYGFLSLKDRSYRIVGNEDRMAVYGATVGDAVLHPNGTAFLCGDGTLLPVSIRIRSGYMNATAAITALLALSQAAEVNFTYRIDPTAPEHVANAFVSQFPENGE